MCVRQISDWIQNWLSRVPKRKIVPLAYSFVIQLFGIWQACAQYLHHFGWHCIRRIRDRKTWTWWRDPSARDSSLEWTQSQVRGGPRRGRHPQSVCAPLRASDRWNTWARKRNYLRTEWGTWSHAWEHSRGRGEEGENSPWKNLPMEDDGHVRPEGEAVNLSCPVDRLGCIKHGYVRNVWGGVEDARVLQHRHHCLVGGGRLGGGRGGNNCQK